MPPDPKVATGVLAVVARPNPYTNAMIDPQFLIIHRIGEPPAEGQGTWSIPGGWMDEWESIHEAARRETHEEVGLSTSFLNSECRPLGVVTHRNQERDLWCVTIFVGLYALSDEPVLQEPEKVDEAKWVTRRDFARLHDSELFLPVQIARREGIF